MGRSTTRPQLDRAGKPPCTPKTAFGVFPKKSVPPVSGDWANENKNGVGITQEKYKNAGRKIYEE